MSKVSEVFEMVLPVLAKKAIGKVRIDARYGDESALSILYAAYNQMQDEEFNGEGYIFNLNDNKDLKYLVDHEILNACQIADIYPKCKASGLFRIEEDEIAIISLAELKDIVCSNMETLLRCVLMYVGEGNDVYNKVYNMLIADDLV
jgi:hypothetical protein